MKAKFNLIFSSENFTTGLSETVIFFFKVLVTKLAEFNVHKRFIRHWTKSNLGLKICKQDF